MARNKFLKKTEKNPLKEVAVFIFLIVIILAVFILTVRAFIQNEQKKPFLTQNQKQLDYLSFELYLPQKQHEVEDGQPVEVSMVVKNISDKPIELNFPYSIEVDFLAYRLDNLILFRLPSLVWCYSIEQKSTKKPHSVILKPNEARVFSAKWNKKTQSGVDIKAGEYKIVGKMITEDFTVSLTVGKQP